MEDYMNIFDKVAMIFNVEKFNASDNLVAKAELVGILEDLGDNVEELHEADAYVSAVKGDKSYYVINEEVRQLVPVSVDFVSPVNKDTGEIMSDEELCDLMEKQVMYDMFGAEAVEYYEEDDTDCDDMYCCPKCTCNGCCEETQCGEEPCANEDTTGGYDNVKEVPVTEKMFFSVERFIESCEADGDPKEYIDMCRRLWADKCDGREMVDQAINVGGRDYSISADWCVYSDGTPVPKEVEESASLDDLIKRVFGRY